MKNKPEPVVIDAETKALLDRYVLTDVPSHLLRRAHFMAENIFIQAFGQHDLTPRQKALLVIIYQNPGANQNVLAEKIVLDRNTFSEMLNRMVKAGYVRRERAKRDGRAYEIYLTQTGIDLLKKVLPLDGIVEQRLLGALAPELRPLFIKCLKVIIGIEKPDAL